MGFYDDEDPSIWKRWWVTMWAVIFVGLMVSVFLLPFRDWAIAATFLFGVPELVGLYRKLDPYPPLTHVTRYYLPRWVTFTAIYGLVGACGAFWLGFQAPWRIGGIFALLGWLSSHFDITYDSSEESHIVRSVRRRLER